MATLLTPPVVRSCVVIVLWLTAVVLMPLGVDLIPCIVFSALACAAIVLVLMSGTCWPEPRDWKRSRTRLLVWGWVLGCVLVLSYIDAVFPDTELKQWQEIMLPGRLFRVRSILEAGIIVLMVRGLFWSMSRLTSRGSSRIAAVLIGIVLLTVLGWSVKGGGSKEYIALFGDQLPRGRTALQLVDWATLLWIGVAVPLAMALDTSPAESKVLLSPPAVARGALAFSLSLVPLAVMLGILRLSSPAPYTDTLPALWWVRKIVVVFFSAACEETLFRLLAGAACIRLLASTAQDSAKNWAILWTALLFFVAHVGGPPGTLLTAGLLGTVNGILLFRLRSLDACSFGHTIANTVLGRWNAY